MQQLAVDEVPASEQVRGAIRRFLDEALAAHGDRIERVILFGSVARGQATGESDVDLLTVWRGPQDEALDALVPLTTRILRDTGVDIMTHPVTTEQFAHIREMRTGFYENVERKGVLVHGRADDLWI